MLGARKITNQEPTPYATSADFCRIFERDMNHLYLLSFLLTGNQSMAEQCFVRGLDDSKKGNQVFKEWAQSWARRAIIQNAIRMIRPRSTDSGRSSSASDGSAGQTLAAPAEIAGIIELPTFERFAFVMSALEHYSDQECSLLLDCSGGEVVAARTRALQQIGRSAQLPGKLVSIESKQKALQDEPKPGLQLKSISPLPATA